MALIGQTAELAPADKKIYALRDATSTVESIGLICASIMSKKLAEGIDALVLDVKTGSGAFMQKEEDSVRLAELLVETAQRMGKKAVALITDMGQPLGRFAGHSHEVIESIEVLRGRGAADLSKLSIELSAWMFYLGQRTKSIEEGRALAQKLVTCGEALEKFKEGIALQGGDPHVVNDYSLLPQAKNRAEVKSPSTGFLSATNCMEFGIALAKLGGGREKAEDQIDPGVALEFHKRIGDPITVGDTLVTIHYNSSARLAESHTRISESFVFSDQPIAPSRLIRRLIGQPL
jgi:pyrimidine-nucleoside phosphorylase